MRSQRVGGTSGCAVLLHGGYGVFGDLDLQDGWCRSLAHAWRCDVVSVDYPLAPEHPLRDAVDAVSHAVASVEPRDVILCGDSAGAGLALATAATSRARHLVGLMLTNPNIDLSLRRFDRNAIAGPDADLSERAFATWTHEWTQSSDFVAGAAALPPTVVAVGRHDAVLREARDLASALASAGQRHELAEYDAGHGFLADTAISSDILARARRFFAP